MLEAYLAPARYVESDSPDIQHFARYATGNASDAVEKSVRIYLAVRDEISYSPYENFHDPRTFSAREALASKRGFCIPKAALMAACARSQNIPARLGFADVRNHLASKRMLEAASGDVFRWHAYCELYLDDKWVKATPAFDKRLCKKTGLTPLDFDGKNDSIFHSYDNDRRHMEYIKEYGHFPDVPYEQIIETWQRLSPGLLDEKYLSASSTFSDDLNTES